MMEETEGKYKAAERTWGCASSLRHRVRIANKTSKRKDIDVIGTNQQSDRGGGWQSRYSGGPHEVRTPGETA